jgi:ribosomal-protein-alanine N-acetyltransferase
MPQPFSLSTDRLVLRRFVQDDLDDLLRFHRNPAVQTGYDPEGKPWSDGSIAQRLKSYIAEHEKQGFSRWKLSLANGQFIGRAGLGWFVEGESVELGYGLLPEYWGFGYAREASAALIRWGFDNLPISKIVAFTYPWNARSTKALAALGVNYVDDRVRSPKDGACAYYEITRAQAAEPNVASRVRASR